MDLLPPTSAGPTIRPATGFATGGTAAGTTGTAAPVALRRIASPIGRIEIVGDGTAIVSVAIERDGRLPADHIPESRDPIVDAGAIQLAEYFAGDRTAFDLPVRLPGTRFQRAVWEQLVRLAFGEVVSYGELGRRTGRRSAGRAIGGAVGANPVPLIVPCHRVLGSDGRITGYSGGQGIPTKAWLLDHEGIAHRTPAAAAERTQPGLDIPAA